MGEMKRVNKLDNTEEAMQEKWSKWYPVNIPSEWYELELILEDWDGLKLAFESENLRVEVLYEYFLAIRHCDESYRWNTISAALANYGGDFFKGHLFFKVEDSEFMSWFSKESFGWIDGGRRKYQHHVYTTPNDIVDVLAWDDPVIEVKEKPQKSNEIKSIERLQAWYRNNCGGDWEHSYGVKIETLDNPGWSVKIDLSETRYKDLKHDKLNKDYGDHDWMQCSISDKVFVGCGSCNKLNMILQTFFEWVDEYDDCHI